MTRASLASAAAAVCLLAACGIPDDARPRPLGEDAPFELLDPAGTTTTSAVPQVATAPADVYLVTQERLARVTRQVPVPVSLQKVLATLLDGPTGEEAGAGLRSALGPQAGIRSASTAGDSATIDLNESFGETDGAEQILALAQLVFTATALPGVHVVEFKLAGSSVEVPRGDGTLHYGPLGRADFAALAPGDT